MVKRYNLGSATHDYILGFARDGLIYAVEIKNATNLIYAITTIEMRKGAGYVVRYVPNRKQQDLILANANRVEILGSLEAMEQGKAQFNNNRGCWFEYQCAKTWNAKQNDKQNAKFTECGDITTQDGTQFQCKFGYRNGKATFVSEKTLNNLGL